MLGNFANTPEGKLSKAVKAAIAQFETRQRSDRSRRGRRGRAAAGYVLPKGRGAPMGYRYVRDDDHKGHLEIDEVQAETVRQLFSWADAGWTVHQIVTRLNEEGTSSPTRAKWLPSTVQRILRNTIYNGILVSQHAKARGQERQAAYHSPAPARSGSRCTCRPWWTKTSGSVSS